MNNRRISPDRPQQGHSLLRTAWQRPCGPRRPGSAGLVRKHTRGPHLGARLPIALRRRLKAVAQPVTLAVRDRSVPRGRSEQMAVLGPLRGFQTTAMLKRPECRSRKPCQTKTHPNEARRLFVITSGRYVRC